MAEPWVGRSLPRQEDAALLRGKARFIDDIVPVTGLRQAAILRSPHAHAEILSVDTTRAEALPGVIGILTGADVAAATKPLSNMLTDRITFYPCAVDRVRYFGEPVAVVVASDRYVAEDALDLIDVRYRPLQPVVEIATALDESSVPIHPKLGGNVVQHRTFRYGDPDAAFRAAHRTVALNVDYPRVNSTPMETYGLVAEYDPGNGRHTVWSNFQGPFALQPLMCDALRVRSHQLRLVTAPASGGSFGIKHGIFPYLVLMAVASRRFGCPVKWIEDRLEHLTASSAASGRLTRIEGAFDPDGVLTALRLAQTENVGAFIRVPEPAGLYRMHATANGPYRVRNIAVDNRVVVTNQVPSGLNRGFGGPQFYYPVERLMDVAAVELGIDPAELRRRNFVPPDAFPYEGPAGSVLDSGDYGRALDLALETAGYGALREEQARRRASGRLYGIGIAAAVETSGSNMGYVSLALTPEQRAASLPKSGASASARLTIDALGSIVVHIDSVPNGQGHRTAIAQVVADELGVAPEAVEVVTELDTLNGAWSITSGNYANRFSTTVASAAAMTARQAAAKLRIVAGRELGAAPDQVILAGGMASAPGGRNAPIPIRRLAGQLHWDSSNLPDGITAFISEGATFSPATMAAPDAVDRLRSSLTYSFQCDVAAVEIDPRTGQVTVERYVTVHDAGNMLNPMLVEGQILGGFAHGFGAAMWERVAYGPDGTPLATTFQDYMVPTADSLPRLAIGHVCTPSPNTLHGSKGLGDGSSMIAPVTVANAIADAIGTRDLLPPFTPGRVWALLNGIDPDERPSPAESGATLSDRPLTGGGSVTLDAPPDRVWSMLLDVPALAEIIPGCRSIRESAPNQFEAEVELRVAGIGGSYRAEIRLDDLHPPHRLRLSGEANGALGGGAGEASVELAPLPDGRTRLDYSYGAAVTGKVASFGHRMLDGVIGLLIGAFFDGLQGRLGGRRRTSRLRSAWRWAGLILRGLRR